MTNTLARNVLTAVIDDAIAAHTNRPAVADRKGEISYTELGVRSMHLAQALRRWADDLPASSGERRRIGIYAPNSTAYVETYVGLLRAGMVPFLMEPAMGPSEVEHVVLSCSLDGIVHDGQLSPPYGEALPAPLGALGITPVPHDHKRRLPLSPDTEVCRFTSGSTGFPNCIEFSGAAVHAAASGWVEGTGLSAEDRVLCFAGLPNGLAFNTSLLPVLLAGASVYLTSGLPSATKVLTLLHATQATRLTGFPALYDSLVRRRASRESLSRLRVAVSAGARLRPETAAELREHSGLVISDYYGIAETGPLTFEPEPERHRGLGLPLPGVVLRCQGTPDHPADILVTSRSMGSRYLNSPGTLEARLDADRFYQTGDRGYLENGRLVLVGRNAHAINLGGRKVDAEEVRRVLIQAAGVDDALVFATTNTGGDDILVALVAGRDSVDADAVRDHCLDHLAAFKVPERLLIVPSLPVNSIGKPRIEVARQMVESLGEPTP